VNVIVNVPGVSVAAPSVNVGASSAAVAVAGAKATSMASGIAIGGASAGGYVFAGGGGGYYGNAGIASSTITGLNVDGGYETRTIEEDVATLEDYCVDKIKEEIVSRPVQAMCIDDKNTPHPASRLDDHGQADKRFSGELYRCMAGTHMQVTIGKMDKGEPSFASGDAFSCAKGEALWHSPGGVLTCKPQRAERNCNERSLLRRFGPGVKLVEVKTSTKICEPAQRTKMTKVTREVKSPRTLPAGNLVLDGGVGNGY
jgi:hypothetical protein